MQQEFIKKKYQVDKRALTALFMFFSFVWLVPTGITMHFIAQTSFELIRHIVMSLHNTAAVIFVTSAVVHLTLNWKSMKRYMASKINEYFPYRTEAIIAAIVVTGLLLFIGSHPLHLR